jgi:opacity protein-like surface antigen
MLFISHDSPQVIDFPFNFTESSGIAGFLIYKTLILNWLQCSLDVPSQVVDFSRVATVFHDFSSFFMRFFSRKDLIFRELRGIRGVNLIAKQAESAFWRQYHQFYCNEKPTCESLWARAAPRHGRIGRHKFMKHPVPPKVMAMAAGCGILAANQLQAADSNWFLKAEAGPSFVNNISTTTTSLFGGPPVTTRSAFKTGVRLDLDGGYQFNESWAIDMELGYIYNQVDFSNSSATASPDLYQVPFLVNAVFTLPVNWRVKPYAGAGVGLVLTGLNDFRDVTGAGQLLAGVKYDLNGRVDLGLGYKFLVTTTHDWSDILDTTQGGRTIDNSILATVTINF